MVLKKINGIWFVICGDAVAFINDEQVSSIDNENDFKTFMADRIMNIMGKTDKEFYILNYYSQDDIKFFYDAVRITLFEGNLDNYFYIIDKEDKIQYYYEIENDTLSVFKRSVYDDDELEEYCQPISLDVLECFDDKSLFKEDRISNKFFDDYNNSSINNYVSFLDYYFIIKIGLKDYLNEWLSKL